jgi:hypothetical protein
VSELASTPNRRTDGFRRPSGNPRSGDVKSFGFKPRSKTNGPNADSKSDAFARGGSAVPISRPRSQPKDHVAVALAGVAHGAETVKHERVKPDVAVAPLVGLVLVG